MYLVFDIGGTAIKYCHMNEHGEIFDKHEISSKKLNSLEVFIETISSIYHQSKEKIEGIALASPGVIDAQQGVINIVMAYPYLSGQNVTKLLSKACDGVKVTVENDAKCAGLAEAWKGNAQDYQDAVMVIIGTGIGGAVIKDKQIHHGAHLFAGEISTMILNYNPKTKKALTWSDVASTRALCIHVAKALGIAEINGREVFALANQGNQTVLEVLKEFCYQTAIQLFNVQYVYDPEIICIGGGISKQPLLIEMLNVAIDEIGEASNQLLKPKITSCKFYNDANLIGALAYFLMMK